MAKLLATAALCTACLFVSSKLHAQISLPQLPSFIATCYAGETRRYDYFTDYNGNVVAEEWSENEKFLNKDAWEIFSYESGDNFVSLFKANAKASIVARYGYLIIASDPFEALGGVGVWSYAINLHLDKIVATSTHTEGMSLQKKDKAATGLKARIVQLQCEFEYSSHPPLLPDFGDYGRRVAPE